MRPAAGVFRSRRRVVDLRKIYLVRVSEMIQSCSAATIARCFFQTETGREPVREWLKALPKEERRIIGEDIMTVQFR